MKSGIKVELLVDMGNKAKGSIIELRGNTAARLIRRKKAKLSDADIKVIESEEAKKFKLKTAKAEAKAKTKKV